MPLCCASFSCACLRWVGAPGYEISKYVILGMAFAEVIICAIINLFPIMVVANIMVISAGVADRGGHRGHHHAALRGAHAATGLLGLRLPHELRPTPSDVSGPMHAAST